MFVHAFKNVSEFYRGERVPDDEGTRTVPGRERASGDTTPAVSGRDEELQGAYGHSGRDLQRERLAIYIS